VNEDDCIRGLNFMTTSARRVLDRICPPPTIGSADVMKVRVILRLLRDDGWFEVATRGSHVQFKHPTKAGRVTVAGHPDDDLAPGTLKSILDQAKLKEP
jgi:predicted RNA binding protein YcfA (HicA-like mRNA interferase family)